MNEKTEWQKKFEAFYEKYPECPISQDIDKLNLIMKREYAEAIKKGTKRIEFRQFSQFYCNKLFDKNVDNYVNTHKDNKDIIKALDENIITPMRIVKALHFYNYNKSWTMDVKCIENGVIMLCEEDVKYLQDKYGCHELDEDLKSYEGVPDEQRPLLFYFAVGEITESNNI